jgi:putative SOS response-associated peptidase YedK
MEQRKNMSPDDSPDFGWQCCAMCNLYSATTTQESVRRLFPKLKDRAGNLRPMDTVYPDQEAPIIRNGSGGDVELVLARWGMPSPAFALEGKKTDRGVTNIRNTASPHWRRWLGVEHRCLVPITAFAEPARGPDGKSRNQWFAPADPDQPMFFAGLWTSWTSVRKLAEGEVTADLYGFLTTDPNAIVAPVHPKAMPVILTEPAEWDMWMTAPWPDAKRLQRPLADGLLQLVGE